MFTVSSNPFSIVIAVDRYRSPASARSNVSARAECLSGAGLQFGDARSRKTERMLATW
jgi:hypothetical protein